MDVIQTPRLILRNLSLSDGPFILDLLNSPTWLQYIGDRGIRSLEDAVDYIKHNPSSSYVRTKFGLKAVLLKANKVPIGVCGLIQRPYLDRPDLGFAFLPTYAGQGYGFESSTAILQQINAKRPIYAITSTENVASKALL